ncbi:TPA: hypothetical protein N0F65_009387 [Lagenidium giganteum]|uniref:Glutathione S-transferase 3, mitochondrial n=1 Tax=Lagenidium giganteum TaxID=4803 RepID=A0AAV2ZJ27_9STRA|nr:TPA: hypothetical protein N0F65_009387 [Lagenidium giganteum]
MAASDISVTLQRDHAYVLLLVVLTAFVNLWAGLKVGAARKKYDVQYPQMYAEKSDKNAKAFNCVQRAHQNFLENVPFFFAFLVTSSVYRPCFAAIAGFVRLLGFIVYIESYASGDPKKRLRGGFGYFGLLGSLVLTIEAALKLLGFL